jgi:hypothetical protein
MPLDYEIIQDKEDKNKFLIWTPDETGAVLGSGPTRTSALQDAISTMAMTIADMMGCSVKEENSNASTK